MGGLNSKARHMLNQIPHKVAKWVYSEDMTAEENAQHPTHETTGGYLKVLDESDSAVLWWNGLTNREKAIIMELPNFDKAIFKEISGIDVEEINAEPVTFKISEDSDDGAIYDASDEALSRGCTAVDTM